MSKISRLIAMFALVFTSALALGVPAISADGGSASCSPSDGSIAVNASVSCSFTPDSTGTFLFWSAPGFTPQSTSDTGATFIATRAGSGTITAYWSVPGLGSQSQTFSYTITAPAPSASVNCSPADGTIALNSTVGCSFSGANGARFMFWSAPGFTPQSSTSPTASFSAARAGSGSITAHYSVPGQGGVAQTFNYTISAS